MYAFPIFVTSIMPLIDTGNRQETEGERIDCLLQVPTLSPTEVKAGLSSGCFRLFQRILYRCVRTKRLLRSEVNLSGENSPDNDVSNVSEGNLRLPVT